MRDFSLAHLTVLSLPPPEMIDVAARTGYAAVGLRLIAVTPDSPGYPLMKDPPSMRETRARLSATGLRVGDIEFVKITPDIDLPALEPFLVAGAELHARHVVAAPYDPDLGRLTDRLGALADLAGRYGLSVLLEFFPWTVVPNLPDADRVVEAADSGNVGILLDTLHFDRSNSALKDIDAIPPWRFPMIHVADARRQSSYSTDDLLHTARAERLPTGDGEIDIASILRRLPADATIGLEVPMERLTREQGPEAVARRVREAAARMFERL